MSNLAITATIIESVKIEASIAEEVKIDTTILAGVLQTTYPIPINIDGGAPGSRYLSVNKIDGGYI